MHIGSDIVAAAHLAWALTILDPRGKRPEVAWCENVRWRSAVAPPAATPEVAASSGLLNILSQKGEGAHSRVARCNDHF
jgi:hypothetical protein